MPAPKTEWTDDLIDELIQLMESGETITAIAARKNMPSASTIWRWESAGDELSERITRAREIGFTTMAEKAREKAQSAEDPQKGRLAFDADRWFLGKMCPKRFGDKIDVTSGNERIQREANPVEMFSRLAAIAQRQQSGDEPTDDAG